MPPKHSGKCTRRDIMELYTGLITQGIYLQLILFCVIRIVSMVTVPPVFNPRPQDVVVTLGSTAELPCSVRNLGSREVIWKKKSQAHALTVGTFVFDKDPSLRVNHVPYNDEWNLVIEGVQRKHQGVYECQLSTVEDMVQYVRLKVEDMPIRDTPDKGISLLGPKHVLKGHPIRLSCNSSGESDFIEDSTTWFHNGRIIKPDARKDIVINQYKIDRKTYYSELIIKNSRVEDSGNYSCRYGRKLTDHTLIVESSDSNNTRRGAKPKPVENMRTEHVQSNRNGKSGLRITSFLWMVTTLVASVFVSLS